MMKILFISDNRSESMKLASVIKLFSDDQKKLQMNIVLKESQCIK